MLDYRYFYVAVGMLIVTIAQKLLEKAKVYCNPLYLDILNNSYFISDKYES